VHPHILCKHKLLFWMRLIAINRLTALLIAFKNHSNILHFQLIEIN